MVEDVVRDLRCGLSTMARTSPRSLGSGRAPESRDFKPSVATRLRYGIAFEPLTTRQQAIIDRLLFSCMRDHARDHRHLQGNTADTRKTNSGKRSAFRVIPPTSVDLQAIITPLRTDTMGRGTPLTGTVAEFSCTGCAVFVSAIRAEPARTWVEVQLSASDGLRIRTFGRVAHVATL